ncbi:hypothetical protein [Microbacterium thalassium]|uniref:Uncharacterized protein n=1 Tax=Microbacterium thalassium TaxID=362649 RepID=A0A7X0FPN2_9MICO|nr:hypothetical protein [Microbacterium thalassium]MBB6390776.1 hypothetical protein [Microbacterium thalassium]GLK25884.1 hypothetical protein GCM10017607_32030 [Microbacterium thalassium]
MDDDDLAELDELRRRAYGPGADIAADATARDRLAELEQRAHQARHSSITTSDPSDARPPARAEEPPVVPAPAPVPSLSTGAADDHPAPADAAVDARRPRTLLLVGVAVVALALAFATGLRPNLTEDGPSAADPMPTAAALASARVLDRIPVTGSLGNSLLVEVVDEWPTLPITGEIDWASSLGDHFGWELWLYGADAPGARVHCLLLERHGNVRYSCAPVANAARGSLHLELPIEEVAVARRLLGVDRLDFQWRADGVVIVTAIADR